MEELFADFVIIGSGPAGQKGAIQAAKLGKSVVVIEKEPYPGGASLNSGTIPSKSLREAIIDLTNFYQKSFYGRTNEVKIDSLLCVFQQMACESLINLALPRLSVG